MLTYIYKWGGNFAVCVKLCISVWEFFIVFIRGG